MLWGLVKGIRLEPHQVRCLGWIVGSSLCFFPISIHNMAQLCSRPIDWPTLSSDLRGHEHAWGLNNHKGSNYYWNYNGCGFPRPLGTDGTWCLWDSYQSSRDGFAWWVQFQSTFQTMWSLISSWRKVIPSSAVIWSSCMFRTKF